MVELTSSEGAPGAGDSWTKWLSTLAHLRIDRARGKAPHKPLLLLVILELAESAQLKSEILPRSGELAFRFCTFWTVVAARRTQKADISLPFFHLSSDGVWSALDETGNVTTERKRTVAVRFDPEFFSCIHAPSFIVQARRVLVERYFEDPAERAALCELVGVPLPADGGNLTEPTIYEKAKKRGREARFSLTVVAAYDYTCALTGLRLIAANSESIVEAAHIHQFSDSRNNAPDNGIAVSKNAHWLFDRGLWTLSETYQVLVAVEAFDEAGPEPLLLKGYAGSSVRLPAQRSLWPNQSYLEWHRTNRFKGRL